MGTAEKGHAPMWDEDAVQVVSPGTVATLALDAGGPLGDVRDMLRNVHPSTMRPCGRARHSFDRDPTSRGAAYIATGAA